MTKNLLKKRALPIESSLEGNEGKTGEIGEVWKRLKTKVSSCQNHPTHPEAPKSKTYKNRTLALSHSFPIETSLEGDEGNMEEIERSMNNRKYARKSQWWRWWLNTIAREFPRREGIIGYYRCFSTIWRLYELISKPNYSRVYWRVRSWFAYSIIFQRAHP